MTPLLPLKDINVPAEILGAVPVRAALHYSVLPLAKNQGTLRLAVPTDFSSHLKEEIRVILGCELEFVPCERSEIEEMLRRFYGVGAGTIERLVESREKEVAESFSFEIIDQDLCADATVTKLVNELFLDALNHRASDIHLEPFEKSFRVRYRVDGVLQQARVSENARGLVPSLISRIKIMANLDIGEKRLPQDGRIKIKREQEELDLRISVVPSSAGEAVVIRILKSLELLDLQDLGFDVDAIAMIRAQLKNPHGMILVTGPTGAGKSTTLYACLKELNQIERKIITIEDPIEYKLPGVIQIQVNPKIELTFAKALRSMLRHDPDCLMVGEIRDSETAEIAIRSALTGHLVLSTLHTNDAPSAVTRLLEMGIEPFLVSSSIHAVIAQRLVRKICPPCERCHGTGFFGRTAVYEIMTISEEIRAMISEKKSSSMIRRQAIQDGMAGLSEIGMHKIKQGIVTSEEIQRTIACES